MRTPYLNHMARLYAVHRRLCKAEPERRGATPPVNAARLAAAVGVSHRQMQRYVAVLRALGAPLRHDPVTGRSVYSRPWDFRAALFEYLSNLVPARRGRR